MPPKIANIIYLNLYHEYLNSIGVEDSQIIEIALDEVRNAKYRNPIELDNYITSASMHTLHKERIILNINGLSNNNEQKELITLIHTHYQNKVKQSVETMTGLKVNEVNVHVQGVNIEKTEEN